MPKGHGSKYAVLSEQALVVLLETGGDLALASKKLGVSERTLGRWRDEPEFARRLDAAREALIGRVVDRLAAKTDAMVGVVVGLAGDHRERGHVRLRAALGGLQLLLTYRAHLDIEKRFRQLEERLLATEAGQYIASGHDALVNGHSVLRDGDDYD